MYEVIMPKLGLDMEEASIVEWYKKEGDRVSKGEALVSVMTDKVTMDLESDYTGYLVKILYAAGEQVAVNRPIACVGEKDEQVEPEAADSNGKAAPVVRSADKRPRAVSRTERVAAAKRVKISPLARKTARELAVDWLNEEIKGSAPGGRIIKSDILAFAHRRSSAGGISQEPIPIGRSQTGEIAVHTRKPLRGIRKTIAQRMTQSKREIPHIVLNAKANAAALVECKRKFNEWSATKEPVKVTFTDILLKICSAALRRNLGINSSLQGDQIVIYDDINVGFALSVNEELVVPTIYHCDRLGIFEIAKKKQELVEKANSGSLALADLSNGTFTLTNLGMYRVRSSSAIINPPQAAILAVGEIYTEPAVVEGGVGVGTFVNISLSCDHRVIDGAAGAVFLTQVVELIEDPAMLLLF